MAGGVEHSGEHGSGATVHGMRIRRHREVAEEQGISARPKRWPKGAAVAVVAIAGGQEVSALTAMALEATKLKSNGMGR